MSKGVGVSEREEGKIHSLFFPPVCLLGREERTRMEKQRWRYRMKEREDEKRER